jgi:hypothetical protein
MLQIANFVMWHKPWSSEKKFSINVNKFFFNAKTIENNIKKLPWNYKFYQNLTKFLQIFARIHDKIFIFIFKGQKVAPIGEKQIMITIVNYNL